MRKEQGVVVIQREIIKGVFDMWIQCEMAKEARAGQFVAFFTKGESTLLPRPISICEVNEEGTQIRIVYRVVGVGTEEFATYEQGDSIAMLGVLGNGFPVDEAQGKKVLLMAGGIGIPPMVELAKQLEGNVHIALGYANQHTFLAEELEQYGTVLIATDDGSVGTKGNVMDAIREAKVIPELIYACGPMPMLSAVKQYAHEHGIDAYISLEEHMACGVGACLGCVVKTKEIDHHSHVHNARICTDGPVFLAKEVAI